MISLRIAPRPVIHTLLSLVSALALALMLVAPQPAQARGHGVGGLIVGAAAAVIVVCSLDPSACRNGRGGQGGRGPGDAIALDAQAKKDIQSGLANLGFYTGAIDGLFGAGTRGSIRKYQSAIGASATGMLTGVQINDLIALAPRYAQLPADDVRLFEATIAGDVDRAQMRQIQAELNGRGYNAGPVDGAWGGKTRGAVEAYMRDNFLPGPALPSRRLLAHLQGMPAPEPAGAHMARVSAPPPAILPQVMSQAAPLPALPQTGLGGAAQPAPAVIAAPAPGQLSFDLLGMRPGMSQSDVLSSLERELSGDLASAFLRDGAEFNGDAVFNLAIATSASNWPAAGSEQVLSLFDESAPETGALAIFRTIILPESVTQAVFTEQILPDLVAKYGNEGRVGDGLTWIGDGAARAAIQSGAMPAAACGSLGATLPDPAAPGSHLRLEPAAAGSVRNACGQVLQVRYTPGALYMALWNSDAILARRAAQEGAGAVPLIKF